MPSPLPIASELSRALSAGLPAAASLLLAAALGSAHAQLAEETLREQRPPRQWDATLGFILGHGPAYAGSGQTVTRLTPGLGLRWGRVSLVSRSAFSVRGVEAGAGGGLRVELSDRERLRVGLGLRTDSGREESDSPELQGLGDIRRTVRIRLTASYRLDDGWRLRSTAAADLLGRGGGVLGDFQVGRDFMLAEQLNANVTLALSWGDRRFMQAYYGVTPEQSQRSGYAVREASAGLRDLSLGLGMRRAITPRWVLFGGASVSRLLGQAARSPLSFEKEAWALNAGLAHRF